MQSGWRKRRNWEWAEANADLLEGVLPESCRNAALATCRISLRDKDSTAAGGAWGFAVLTTMQTFGHIPEGVKTAIAVAHHWITLQAAESADVVLSCFGLTLAEVIDYYGMPTEGEKIDVDLIDIVSALRPECSFVVVS